MRARPTPWALHRQFDELMGSVLPMRIYLWLRGLGLAVAKKFMPARFGDFEGVPSLLPKWAYAALCKVAMDEPELSPKALTPHLQRAQVPCCNLEVGAGYVRLWERVNRAARHVFVLGDADGSVQGSLPAAIARLSAERPGQIVVVWTGASAPCMIDLARRVQWIDLERSSGLHQVAKQAIVLGRALIEIKPATIHVASSGTGWAMYLAAAPALSESSCLYAEIPPLAIGCARSLPGVAEQSVASGLSRSIHLVASSHSIVKQWMACYGLDPAVISVLPDTDRPSAVEPEFLDSVVEVARLEALSGYIRQ